MVDKPSGLLSVPGRHAAHKDSVLSRLRARYPEAIGPLLVHRLDLDASLVLSLPCKNRGRSCVELQRQFARREVKKRYVAVLDGALAGECGAVDLPLRADIDDRPRQISDDPVHGRAAHTEWAVAHREKARVLASIFSDYRPLASAARSCIASVGIGGTGIVGDRLYGWPRRWPPASPCRSACLRSSTKRRVARVYLKARLRSGSIDEPAPNFTMAALVDAW